MTTEEGGKTMWLQWLIEKPQIQKHQAQMLVKPQLENHTPSGAYLICLNCKAVLHKKHNMKGTSMSKTLPVSIE